MLKAINSPAYIRPQLDGIAASCVSGRRLEAIDDISLQNADVVVTHIGHLGGRTLSLHRCKTNKNSENRLPQITSSNLQRVHMPSTRRRETTVPRTASEASSTSTEIAYPVDGKSAAASGDVTTGGVYARSIRNARRRIRLRCTPAAEEVLGWTTASVPTTSTASLLPTSSSEAESRSLLHDSTWMLV